MTPRDVYLVIEYGGRDVTRKRKGTGDVHTVERRRSARLRMSCNEDVVKKRIENVKDVAKYSSLQEQCKRYL